MPRHRRVLSLWFPRMGAERLLRMDRGYIDAPFAVAEQTGQMQVLSSLSDQASAAGLRRCQPLRDAMAMCPDLITRLRNPPAEAHFLTALRRWAAKFSPWIAEEPPDGLIIDLTGCAHLFGGEEPLMAQVEEDCADIRLTVQMGIADTKGAAWAIARYSGQTVASARSGDAIDQEAYATRARAAKRRNWEKGGAAPKVVTPGKASGRIAPPGQTRQVIGPLPIAGLRVSEDIQAQLARVGLRRIEDLIGQPRAGLARRYGRDLVLRLDQAVGAVDEPVSPGSPPPHFACRMSFPEPIGLEKDISAALDRMLPQLEKRLRDKVHGARRMRLEAYRTDQTMQWVEIGLARPSASPDRIKPLLLLKIGELDAGFGIDILRVQATVTEPLQLRQHKGHIDAARAVKERMQADTRLDDLIGRIGARVGLDRITRLHPADSHIPEKSAKVLTVAWSEPAEHWSDDTRERPLVMWPTEPVAAPDAPSLPRTFKWRGRMHVTAFAQGPERIAPEWWLDDPNWRTGTRDYWRVTTERGDQIWLYYAHGGTMSSGWFAQGAFA